ncbi:Augmenter of liver regeneration, partial [Globisporangium splendens]
MADAKADPNCVEPACKSKVDMFKSFMGGGRGASTKASGAQQAAQEEPALPKDCPLGREELGNATWGLLHSMGIYYPEKPSKEYQEKTKTFIEALALMYPCVHCAEDFQNEVKKSPPKVDSRTSFSLWLCEQHNIVNKKIGKPAFPCTMEKLDERWKKGRSACWGEDGDDEAIPSSLGQDTE